MYISPCSQISYNSGLHWTAFEPHNLLWVYHVCLSVCLSVSLNMPPSLRASHALMQMPWIFWISFFFCQILHPSNFRFIPTAKTPSKQLQQTAQTNKTASKGNFRYCCTQWSLFLQFFFKSKAPLTSGSALLSVSLDWTTGYKQNAKRLGTPLVQGRWNLFFSSKTTSKREAKLFLSSPQISNQFPHNYFCCFFLVFLEMKITF